MNSERRNVASFRERVSWPKSFFGKFVSFLRIIKIGSRYVRDINTSNNPVNYDVSKLEAKTEIQILEDINYAINVAQSYLDDLKNNGININGKDILELGPGINFGSALILLWNGANTVTVMDKYIPKYVNGYHDNFYSELSTQYLSRNRIKSDYSLIEYITAVKNSKLLIIEKSLEESHSLEERYDIVFSCAVLEHLSNPKKALKNLKCLLKNESFGSHQIDFRDHRDFSKPLEYLKLDELEFFDLFVTLHGECGNRLRANQWLYLFNDNFSNQANLTPNLFADPNYIKDLLRFLNSNPVSNYSQFSIEDLSVISGRVIHINS